MAGARGVDRREPFALADPVFEVGAQLLAQRGAALLVEAARKAFDVCPGFRCSNASTARIACLWLIATGVRLRFDFRLVAAFPLRGESRGGSWTETLLVMQITVVSKAAAVWCLDTAPGGARKDPGWQRAEDGADASHVRDTFQSLRMARGGKT